MEKPQTIERVRRRLGRVYSRAAIPYVVAGLLLSVAVVVGGREIEHHINAIESAIERLGPWGVVVFVAIFAGTTSMLIPDTILCILAGALFGGGMGFAAALAGGTLAAAIQFALARRVLRSRIQRMLAAKPSLDAIQRAVMRDEFRLQVLLRLTPLNPATISYVLGSAGVRFRGFLIAFFASTPHLALEVYFGLAGKHAAKIAGGQGRTTHLHEFTMIGGLVLCFLALYFVSKMARKALLHAVADAGPRDPADISGNGGRPCVQ